MVPARCGLSFCLLLSNVIRFPTSEPRSIRRFHASPGYQIVLVDRQLSTGASHVGVAETVLCCLGNARCEQRVLLNASAGSEGLLADLGMSIVHGGLAASDGRFASPLRWPPPAAAYPFSPKRPPNIAMGAGSTWLTRRQNSRRQLILCLL
ncbi:hypothetical protein XU18_0508 [Perkinsela sp. CCAP 1560/4]|nr:hypothetical protein XU18_0508 [Perkinsela sp. CCAP 1560/4]|eukprot:KNH09230.1 hypothetical protein XU18_0508 [Perkinsela sp. CCAP 1560/4]